MISLPSSHKRNEPLLLPIVNANWLIAPTSTKNIDDYQAHATNDNRLHPIKQHNVMIDMVNITHRCPKTGNESIGILHS